MLFSVHPVKPLSRLKLQSATGSEIRAEMVGSALFPQVYLDPKGTWCLLNWGGQFWLPCAHDASSMIWVPWKKLNMQPTGRLRMHRKACIRAPLPTWVDTIKVGGLCRFSTRSGEMCKARNRSWPDLDHVQTKRRFGRLRGNIENSTKTKVPEQRVVKKGGPEDGQMSIVNERHPLWDAPSRNNLEHPNKAIVCLCLPSLRQNKGIGPSKGHQKQWWSEPCSAATSWVAQRQRIDLRFRKTI